MHDFGDCRSRLDVRVCVCVQQFLALMDPKANGNKSHIYLVEQPRDVVRRSSSDVHCRVFKKQKTRLFVTSVADVVFSGLMHRCAGRARSGGALVTLS